jgi:hypothetical protein
LAVDCNTNGVPDICDLEGESSDDCNLNLVPDECDPDLNFNGIPDDCETVGDCNANNLPDAEDIASGWSSDVNTDGIPDECQGLSGNSAWIYAPATASHLANELELGRRGRVVLALVNDVPVDAAAVPFRVESADGTPLWTPLTEEDIAFLGPENPFDVRSLYLDRQGGDWPDTVVFVQVLFDGGSLAPGFHPIMEMNTIQTGVGTASWALAPTPPVLSPAAFAPSGGSEELLIGLVAGDIEVVLAYDCNENGIPDAEELSRGLGSDCNHNQVLDECDLADGFAEDCNGNGVPDECDPDLNNNGVPDDCEDLEDCNANGAPDFEDIDQGYSVDGNLNGVPDECEGLAGNYISFYVPRTAYHHRQRLLEGEPGDIFIGVANDVRIAGVSVPFRFDSDDATPLWAPIQAGDVVFLPEGYASGSETLLLGRQGGIWPDTVTILQSLFPGGVLEPGFHPICRLTVTPSLGGTVTFEAAPVPILYAPPQFVTEGGASEFDVLIAGSPITIGGCCVGRVGDVNMQGGDEPSIGGVAMLIDHLFLTRVALNCVAEADVNQSGGPDPTLDDVTIGDVTFLINYLFIGGGELPACF